MSFLIGHLEEERLKKLDLESGGTQKELPISKEDLDIWEVSWSWKGGYN